MNKPSMIPAPTATANAIASASLTPWRAPTPMTEDQVKKAEAGLQRAWNRLHGATVPPCRRRRAC